MPIQTGNLQIRPPQIANPLEQYGQIQQAKNIQQQQAIDALQIKQLKQGMLYENKTNEILSRHNGDLNKAYPEMIREGIPLKYIKESAQAMEMLDRADITSLQEGLAVVKALRDIATEAVQLPQKDRVPYINQMTTLLEQAGTPQEFTKQLRLMAQDDEAMRLGADQVAIQTQNLENRIKKAGAIKKL